MTARNLAFLAGLLLLTATFAGAQTITSAPPLPAGSAGTAAATSRSRPTARAVKIDPGTADTPEASVTATPPHAPQQPSRGMSRKLKFAIWVGSVALAFAAGAAVEHYRDTHAEPACHYFEPDPCE